MPSPSRRPRRRIGAGGGGGDFRSERAVRRAVEAVRAAHDSVDDAEASDDWRALRPRVARWIGRTASHLPSVNADVAAVRIARVYLRRPELLPAFAPVHAVEST